MDISIRQNLINSVDCMNTNDKNHGFTLLELVISIAILVVLAGVLVPVVMDVYRTVQEKSYIIEAESMFNAMNLYVIDVNKNGPVDVSDLVEDFCEDLDRQTHVLRPYIGGKITKNAYIYGFRYDGIELEIEYLEYMVSGYLIKVNSGKETEILERPQRPD